MGRIRSRLTYANVVATLALFLVLGGGTALASYVISSNSQVGPGTISGHKPPTGKHANIIPGTLNSFDVADNSLTGADIRNRSGVDTCEPPFTARYGRICAGSDGQARNWPGAQYYCANRGLRLPSSTEALALALHYDVPWVDGAQWFWAEEEIFISGDHFARTVADDGGQAFLSELTSQMTVCVTDPSA